MEDLNTHVVIPAAVLIGVFITIYGLKQIYRTTDDVNDGIPIILIPSAPRSAAIDPQARRDYILEQNILQKKVFSKQHMSSSSSTSSTGMSPKSDFPEDGRMDTVYEEEDHDDEEEDDDEESFRFSQNCCICQEDYCDGDEIAWPTNENCQHVYHLNCIMKWLMLDHDECPVCRANYIPEILEAEVLKMEEGNIARVDE